MASECCVSDRAVQKLAGTAIRDRVRCEVTVTVGRLGDVMPLARRSSSPGI